MLELPLSLPALVFMGFVVSLVTVVVPGPVSLVASRITMSRGILAAWWFLLGAVAVDVALFAALAAGMAPLLRTIGALPIVELIGGLALFYGGVTSMRPHPAEQPSVEINVKERSATSLVAMGFLISLFNPHYWFWWVTAGLSFVEAARSHGHSGLVWMLTALIAGVLAWYVPLVWAVHHGKVLLPKRAEHAVMLVIGAILLVLGAGLAGLGGWRLYMHHLAPILAR